MSIGFQSNQTKQPSQHAGNQQAAHPTPADFEHLGQTIAAVQDSVSPVWPLRDFVAVNPYGGLAGSKFLDARQQLKKISDCETLMPLGYYREQFRAGKFGLSELEQAIDDMVADRAHRAETLNANAIYKILDSEVTDQLASDDGQRIRLISEYYDRFTGSDWTEAINEEVSKHCSAHYDEGQAAWSSPYKELPLFQAWRSTALVDRRIEILGLSSFREFVSELPQTTEAAICALLQQSDVPSAIWQEYLLCVALTLPGWSAFTKFKTVESAKKGVEQPDFAGLLAIRLAYDVAVSRQFDFHVDHVSTLGISQRGSEVGSPSHHDALLRLTLLRANELGLRTRVLSGMHTALKNRKKSVAVHDVSRKLAQMVFCIDVRSERIRRNLEQSSSEIDTYGFAGFFGLPFEYVRLGDKEGTNQLPVLLDPKFKVYEEVRCDSNGKEGTAARKRRSRTRNVRHLWKTFQTSAVSCFAFVESTGLLYSEKLLSRLLGRPSSCWHHDGVHAADQERLGPSLRGLNQQNIGTSQQVDMAESILRGIGITKDFAQLVVLCGHGASTENNPLQAGLDCGACAGHSGEANARFAAMLLNQSFVRRGLAERGIEIPSATHFVAGLHDTTTDEISFFDNDLVPEESQGYLNELKTHCVEASKRNRIERLAVLPGNDTESLVKRSQDWSEVRPEWGLTGNAAFVIAPRDLTKSFNLKGESFLHSYDYRTDPEGKLLEQIMTAPLVVANWINMQYYASTVDQKHFGSGKKTIHNVVGKFGILSGSSGDLTTGLPWESIHNGEEYQHDPMRLLSVIEAPRENVARILSDHQNVRELVVNGWVNLVVIDGEQFYRYSENSEWQQLQVGMPFTETLSDERRVAVAV